MPTVPDSYYLAQVQGHLYERRKVQAVPGGFLYHVVDLTTHQRVGSHYGWSTRQGRRRYWTWSLAPPSTPVPGPSPAWAACVEALLDQSRAGECG